jgi:DNA-directed RNA polymerase I subunit RPA2
VLEKDEPDVRSHLAAPHVESFNYFINEGLPLAVENLLPITLERPNEDGGGQRLTMTISSVRMSSPIKSEDCKDPRLLPGECRHLRSTYRAPLYATLVFTLEGGGSVEIDRKVGNVPLMVKSRHCHLYGKTQSELVKMGEEPYEFGGFFIANGNEKAVRLLSLQRRNYVMAIIRPSFTKRGTQYTKYGCMLRYVRADQTGSTVALKLLEPRQSPLIH